LKELFGDEMTRRLTVLMDVMMKSVVGGDIVNVRSKRKWKHEREVGSL
jgi:hypothetical protein